MRPIGEYLDYRKYLSDFYAEHKERHGFTWREFAARCGFGSPVYLKQVIDGKYDLSAKAVAQVVEGLWLVGYEREYFALMVEYCHAKGQLQKQEKLSKMLAIAETNKVKSVGLDKLRFFESFRNPLLRELAPALDGTRPADMAKLCKPRLTASEVSRTLKFLEEAGFLTKDKNGNYRQNHKSVKMPDTPVPTSALQRQMGELALAALDLPQEERNMTGLTLGMSERCYAEVVRELAECRRRIVALVQSDPAVERVYRLNMQLFPMTERIASSQRHEYNSLNKKHSPSLKRRKK